MTTILFPTDFSKCAQEAQKVAFSLAKLFDAELKIIHVVSDTIFTWESEEHFYETIAMFPVTPNAPKIVTQEDGVNYFATALGEIQEEATKQGIHNSIQLLFGDTAHKILEEAKKEDVSMIVMGTNGASGLKEAFVGSITQWVTRKSPCPVLSVRSLPHGEFKVDDLVYASDFKVEDENNNLEVVKIFASYFDAKIHLLYINTPHYFEETHTCLQRIEQVAKDHNLENYQIDIYNHYTVEDGVLTYAKLNDVDLIAVSNHQYGVIRSLVEFRTTEVLVNHATVPVLTLNV